MIESEKNGIPPVVQLVNDLACFCGTAGSIPGSAQWVVGSGVVAGAAKVTAVARTQFHMPICHGCGHNK